MLLCLYFINAKSIFWPETTGILSVGPDFDYQKNDFARQKNDFCNRDERRFFRPRSARITKNNQNLKGIALEKARCSQFSVVKKMTLPPIHFALRFHFVLIESLGEKQNL